MSICFLNDYLTCFIILFFLQIQKFLKQHPKRNILFIQLSFSNNSGQFSKVLSLSFSGPGECTAVCPVKCPQDMMQCDDGPSPIGCPLQDVCLPSKGGTRHTVYKTKRLKNI